MCQGVARIDHEPADEPDFHVPLTTARNADSSISDMRDWAGSDTVLAHVPEYSPVRPETAALHAPFQDCADLLADQPPCMRILPLGSCSIHVPETAPLWLASAVQLPPRYPDCVAALQVPLRSAPDTRMAEAANVTKTQWANIVLNLSRPAAAAASE